LQGKPNGIVTHNHRIEPRQPDTRVPGKQGMPNLLLANSSCVPESGSSDVSGGVTCFPDDRTGIVGQPLVVAEEKNPCVGRKSSQHRASLVRGSGAPYLIAKNQRRSTTRTINPGSLGVIQQAYNHHL